MPLGPGNTETAWRGADDTGNLDLGLVFLISGLIALKAVLSDFLNRYKTRKRTQAVSALSEGQ